MEEIAQTSNLYQNEENATREDLPYNQKERGKLF